MIFFFKKESHKTINLGKIISFKKKTLSPHLRLVRRVMNYWINVGMSIKKKAIQLRSNDLPCWIHLVLGHSLAKWPASPQL